MFERGVSGKRNTSSSPAQMVDTTARDIADKTPVRIVSNKPSPSVQSTGGSVPIEVKEGVQQPASNPNVSPEYQQKVIDVRQSPPGTVISREPPKPMTQGQSISNQMGNIGRNIWYGKETGPEQVAYGPYLNYEYRPSSRQALAETFTTASTSFVGGSVFRVAKNIAFVRRAMTGAMVVGTGYDVGTTAYDIQSGKLAGNMIGYKALQTGVSLGGFVYGAGGRTLIRTPEAKPSVFAKETPSMFENKYIKDVIGYKTKPTTQIKIDEIPGNKYLITNKEMIKLESPGVRTPTIRTTMTERPMELLGINKNIAQSKTTQLSVYGAKIYEKPTTPTSYSSKVPWKFESITKQTKLEPTNTWIDVRLENGKLITKEIPFEKVRFFEDTRAEQSLMLFRERIKPSRSFESDIYTKMESPSKTSLFPKMGLLYFPVERQTYNTGRFTIPEVKSGSINIDAMMYREAQKQDTDVLQRLRESSEQRDEQLSLPKILQLQIPRQNQSQIQRQDTVLDQVTKSQDRTMKDASDLFKPVLYGLPDISSKIVSKNKEEKQGFNVYIKDRSYVHGKKRYAESWKKANTTPLSEEAALSLGGTAVDQSAAASFKIRPTDGQAKQLKIGVDPWGVLSGKFYKSKGTYIESTTNRIDSSGEIKGISALGWIANQRRTTYNPVSTRIDYKAQGSKTIQGTYDIPDFNKIMRGIGL